MYTFSSLFFFSCLNQHHSPPAKQPNSLIKKIFKIWFFISRYSTGTHDVKRFLRQIPEMRACQEIYSRLDPKQYFKTNDIFIPRFVNTIQCAGTPTNPPTCGPANGFMRCLTRFGRVEFVRMPRDPLMCTRQRRVVISNIPVGCYCV